MTERSSPPPADASANQRSGWYGDPWGTHAWRWWDGRTWTGHVSDGLGRAPRLPAWLSPLVLGFGVLSILGAVALAFQAPVAVALGFVPLLIVLPALHWIDRVEPEPWPSRIHALLWGASVAAFVSGVVNSIVVVAANSTVAAVVSAPLIEEFTKGLGVVWAVRRREVDGVMDGIVYAGWIGLGFAIVEDFQYFAIAQEDNVLVATFVIRALLTPFLHPLFTAFIGLAVGLAVERQRPLTTAWWGVVLASASHAAWNGSLALAESLGDGSGAVLLVAFPGFIALFAGAVVTVWRLRRREERVFSEMMPQLAARYGLESREVAPLSDWSTMLVARRSLRGPARRAFDREHEALARLALFHSRKGELDHAEESRLLHQLDQARRQLSERG